MMKIFPGLSGKAFLLLLPLAMSALLSVPCQAGVMLHSTFVLDGPLSGEVAELSSVQTMLGLTSLDYLDKLQDGGRQGNGLLSTTGILTGDVGAHTSTVEWDLSATSYGIFAILIKDGGKVTVNGVEGHLYSLFEVDGAESKIGSAELAFYLDGTITSTSPTAVNGYIPRNISHMTFFGGPAVSPHAPEPTSLALWFGLTVAASVVRVRRA